MPVPIRSRRAIHFSVIVVSDLSLTASFSLAGSPLRGRAVPLLASPTYATPPAPALRLLQRAFLQLAPIMFGSPPFLNLRQQFLRTQCEAFLPCRDPYQKGLKCQSVGLITFSFLLRLALDSS